MIAIPHHAQPSFDETYPKAPFAELIRLALSLAEILIKLRARQSDHASTRSPDEAPA